jgi:hypothetical protein
MDGRAQSLTSRRLITDGESAFMHYGVTCGDLGKQDFGVRYSVFGIRYSVGQEMWRVAGLPPTLRELQRTGDMGYSLPRVAESYAGQGRWI